MCNNRGFGESKINHRDEAENLQNGTKMYPVPLHHGEELWGEGRGWGTWGTPPPPHASLSTAGTSERSPFNCQGNHTGEGKLKIVLGKLIWGYPISPCRRGLLGPRFLPLASRGPAGPGGALQAARPSTERHLKAEKPF